MPPALTQSMPGEGMGGWYGCRKNLKFTVAFDAVWCNLGPLLLIKKCDKIVP